MCVLLLLGLTDEATGGPATRVCVCLRAGDGSNDFIQSVSVYVSGVRVESGGMLRG